MKPFNQKFVGITPPAAIVDNAAFTTAAVDTAGFRTAEIFVYFGAMDIAATVCNVRESDASNMGTPNNITGCVCGTSTNSDGITSTLPTATSDNTLIKFEIPLQGRKRYLDVEVTGGDGSAGTFMTAFALLSDGDNDPSSAVAKGAAQVLFPQ
jgi:hypothetical protein